MNIVEANQRLPYSVMKTRLLHGNQYKNFLNIVNKNIPNISVEEIIEMFKEMSKCGCTAATLANALGDKLCVDDKAFQEMFGFSLKLGNKLDYNKLLVDIYSKLYKVLRVRFVEYEKYVFSSYVEAAQSILGIECDSSSDAALALFSHEIMSNGIDSSGKMIFKKNPPNITELVGTIEEIVREKFNIDGINSVDDLKKLCDSKDIECRFKDLKIEEKLSGLLNTNFNFWANYYLKKSNSNLSLNRETIVAQNFSNDYDKFVQHIYDLIQTGYLVTVSVPSNSKAFMHNKKPLSWGKISSDTAGHAMSFKGFNEKKDIIVSSYGEDHIIPKEYFSELEFNKIRIDDLQFSKKIDENNLSR